MEMEQLLGSPNRALVTALQGGAGSARKERKPTKTEIKPLCDYIVVYVYICISTPGALE